MSVTNSSDGLEGTLLSSDNKSYSTTLLPDVTVSLVTLGVTKGVTLKNNNQAVDLSSLNSLDLSYITLTIE